MEQNDTPLGQGVAPESNPPADEINNNNNMESLLNQEGLALDFPQSGEIRTGVVASISQTQILVSVGAKSEGVITGRELEAIPAEERAALQMGQEILVYVLSDEDSSGNVVLSYTRAQEQKGWADVEKMLEGGTSYEGKVDGFNKGGIIVPVYGLRGFVPASQLGISRRMAVTGDTPDARYAKMIGEPITVRVIEVDRKRRRLILSERAASSETRQSIKERVIESLKEGEVYAGKVTSLADFGAFVNVNGADGLVHLSEISWERVQHPSEVLEVGQEVQVKIINIDREKKRIGLSIRALLGDPWQSKVDKFKVGQLVEGVITRLTKFGAFARLQGDLEGLIHISEISENRIEHPREAGLKEGAVVTLRIIRIDPDQRRIGLSLRKVDSGAYKDLDLKQIDLAGVSLDGVDLGIPEELVPTEEPPAEDLTPDELTRIEPTPDEEPPAEDLMPGELTLIEPAQAEQPPAEDKKPGEVTPVEPAPTKEPPAEDKKPGEVTPIEPAPTKEPPAEDKKPGEVTPIEPAPAEQPPAEDKKPGEVTPIEPTPAEQPPAEGKTSGKKTTKKPAPTKEPPAEGKKPVRKTTKKAAPTEQPPAEAKKPVRKTTKKAAPTKEPPAENKTPGDETLE
jgi:small subunit ribosomal protein S1